MKGPVAMLGLLVAVAVLADVLASDLPLVLRLEGRLYLLPCVVTPPELQVEDEASLRARLDPARGDFLWATPLSRGPNSTRLEEALSPPSGRHPLGTDELGRDVLARLLHGTRVSLAVGLLGVGLATVIGLLLGVWAGARGGWADAWVSRMVEVMLSFPTLLLVLCLAGLVRVQSVWPLVLLLGVTRWAEVARLVRGETLRLREAGWVRAARAAGATPGHILRVHLVPGVLAPLLVSATFAVPGVILLESALAFFGFGVPPPTPSWGELLGQAHRYLTHLPAHGTGSGAWWLTVFPGCLLFITALTFHRLGEGLKRSGIGRAGRTDLR